jgi:hypothetical protein
MRLIMKDGVIYNNTRFDQEARDTILKRKGGRAFVP